MSDIEKKVDKEISGWKDNWSAEETSKIRKTMIEFYRTVEANEKLPKAPNFRNVEYDTCDSCKNFTRIEHGMDRPYHYCKKYNIEFYREEIYWPPPQVCDDFQRRSW